MRRQIELAATIGAVVGVFALAVRLLGWVEVLLWTLASVGLATAWSLGRWLTDDP